MHQWNIDLCVHMHPVVGIYTDVTGCEGGLFETSDELV